ncbi:unnamed protein product [Rhizoctonia solani]|uniref:Uncharacterized protein n=1 Tax=Rhizoctonia solani TaxID=456999 RepID=A0A8H3GC38_9AGAM|nr:unnamed protein product [Rhizoctonia solani]
MSLLMAPYNDSMRLGQGYNSFLQSPCVYNAFTLASPDTRTKSSNSEVSQTVSYTSHVITKISDITRSMGVSTGSSIKNGSIALSGTASSIDEVKFVESDINIVLSVKVVNQNTDLTTNESMNFNKSAAEGVQNGENQKFHEVFGDCFISGFIEGGDLHGIISIKVIDSSKKEEIRAQIMGELNDEEWSLESLNRVVAAFPAKVALCPQRTWAILTPYENNQEFIEWAIPRNIKPYDYSGIKAYASDLLDTYIGYKNNIRRIQSVLANPTKYILGPARDAISISVKDLVLARKQMKAEMTKITDEVDSMNEHPDRFVDTIENSSMKAPELWGNRLPISAQLPSKIVSELRQVALLDSDIAQPDSDDDGNADILGGGLGQPYDPPAKSLYLDEASLTDTEKKALDSALNRQILARYRFSATPVATTSAAGGIAISEDELRDKIRMSAVFSAKFKSPDSVRMSIVIKEGVPVLEFAFVFGEETGNSATHAVANSVILKLEDREEINRVRVGMKVVAGKEAISYVKVWTTGNHEKSVGESPASEKNISDLSPPKGCSALAFWLATAKHSGTGAVGRLVVAWK